MSTPLDPSIKEEVFRLRQQGLSQEAIGHRLGISHGSVGNVLREEQFLRLQAPGIRSDKRVGSANWRDWSKELTQMQRSHRKRSFGQDRATIELGDGNHEICLATLSDMHMGSWGCDYGMLQELTDEIIQTPNLFVGLVGDYGQYAIRLRNVLEISDNIIPPESQTDFIQSWFDEIWPKVAFATWDNHGVERQESTSGESSVKRMLSRRVVYFNGIGHIDIKVGQQVYKGAVSHAWRGTSFLNPVHGPQRYMRFEGPDREFCIGGDTHKPGMMKYPDGDIERVAINCGSLQYNSGFGKRYFSLTTHPAFPCLVLSPHRHRMTPFYSVKEWLDLCGKSSDTTMKMMSGKK